MQRVVQRRTHAGEHACARRVPVAVTVQRRRRRFRLDSPVTVSMTGHTRHTTPTIMLCTQSGAFCRHHGLLCSGFVCACEFDIDIVSTCPFVTDFLATARDIRCPIIRALSRACADDPDCFFLCYTANVIKMQYSRNNCQELVFFLVASVRPEQSDRRPRATRRYDGVIMR